MHQLPLARLRSNTVAKVAHTKTVAELLKFIEPEKLLDGPIHWAAANGYAEVVSLLLETGHIDVNRPCPTSHNTPIYLAACSLDLATVKLLLENGADIHKKFLDRGRWYNFGGNRKRRTSEAVGPSVLHGWASVQRYDTRAFDVKVLEKIGTYFLAAGCDVNVRDGAEKTPLHYIVSASHYGHMGQVVEADATFLLKHGAEVSARDIEGNTPLHLITNLEEGERIIDLLVHSGAAIDAVNKNGLTPLMCALKGWKPSIVRKLLELGADANFTDPDGNSTLHLACAEGSNNGDKVRVLLEFGANIEARNHSGESCLFSFVRQGPWAVDQVMPLLVDQGSDIEVKNHNGQTALLWFASRGCVDMALKLIEMGANCDARDTKGMTAAHVLAHEGIQTVRAGSSTTLGKFAYFQEFIQLGVDPHAIDFEGNNVLHHAIMDSNGCSIGYKDYVIKIKAIKALGIKPDACNHAGQTALHMIAGQAVTSHWIESYERVYKKFAEFLHPSNNICVDCRDNKGRTPLHLAAALSEYRAYTLLKAGADGQSLCFERRSPLHYAAKAGQCNVVGMLADLYQKNSWFVDQIDNKGLTALHEASRAGRPESVKVLLEIGANPMAKDKTGRTALHACAEYKAPEEPESSNRGPGYSYSGSSIDSERATCNIREVIRLLLSHGTSLIEFDAAENTAYDLAIMTGCEEMVHELSPLMQKAEEQLSGDSFITSVKPWDPLREIWVLLRCKSAHQVLDSCGIDASNARGRIRQALKMNSTILVNKLVDTGVDLAKKQSNEQQSPLQTLVRWGFVTMVEKLGDQAQTFDAESEESLFHSATERELSNVEMIKVLVQQRLDVNKRKIVTAYDGKGSTQKFGPSPLHLLAAANYWWQPKAMDYMLETGGADIEICNENGETPLQAAMSGGAYAGFYREEAVAVLLKHGARVNCVSEHGLTPLNRAAEQGEELVRVLVEHGADLSLGKRPAIFDAIACLNVEVVRVLLEAGTDPNGPNTLASRNKSSRNHCRHTAEGHHQFPLEAAYCMMDLGDYQRTRDIVQLLVDYGADVTLPLDKDGTTMLHSFARDGQSLEPFLAQGVDIEQQDSNGCTPLLLAIRCQREIPLTQPTESDDDTLPSVTTAAEQLINAGANLEAVDKAGKTVLHHLMGRNHVPCKRAFAKHIDKGADINARDNKNATPLLTYLRHHCGDCIEDLISAGSDLLAVDNQGNSTFHTLAWHLPSQRYTEFMKAFIAAGVSPNARNLAGNTPLFPFILSSTPSTPLHSWSDGTPTYHRDSVNLLIDAGCDVFATNNKGEGLLHYAARMDQGDTMGYGESRKKEIVGTFQMLMERGLDPRMEDVEGKTPLDIAAACENKGILKLFECEE